MSLRRLVLLVVVMVAAVALSVGWYLSAPRAAADPREELPQSLEAQRRGGWSVTTAPRIRARGINGGRTAACSNATHG
jgi:hypothetical protein